MGAASPVTFIPIDFLRRLATLIPPPFAHLTRYHGVFAPNYHLRAAIVPASAIAATDSSRPASCRRLDWASLLKRVFATDVLVCDARGDAMHILAILPEGDASRAILKHLGLLTEPPLLCLQASGPHPTARRVDRSPVALWKHPFILLMRAGLTTLRAACPRFDAWVTKLEALGVSHKEIPKR